MRTINLQTVYQLVITSLLLGACLGLLGQRLSWLANAMSTFEPAVLAAPALTAVDTQMTSAEAAPQSQDVTKSENLDSNVQIEVEVHTRGNANAIARALGPGDTEVKTSTEGEGDGRSAAYLKAPEAVAWLPSAAQPVATPAVNTAPSTQTGQPKATITEALVNLRSSPDLAGTVLGSALRGQEFTIMGRDAVKSWWLVCCDGGQARWVHDGVVQVTGDVAFVPVVAQAANIIPTHNQAIAVNNHSVANLPIPTLAPPLPTPIPAAQYEFMVMEQAQFEERITPRIYLYVYEREEGLPGYTVHVRKDGYDLPIVKQSAPGMPGFTWPIPSDRQRYTNLKLEFPNISPAGLWEVQLIDGAGQAVGPVVTFRLQPNDPRQEMYVKYRKR